MTAPFISPLMLCRIVPGFAALPAWATSNEAQALLATIVADRPEFITVRGPRGFAGYRNPTATGFKYLGNAASDLHILHGKLVSGYIAANEDAKAHAALDEGPDALIDRLLREDAMVALPVHAMSDGVSQVVAS